MNMKWREYFAAIERKKITHFGFDTHSRALNIPKPEVKSLWNKATDFAFKRVPRTEYTMRYMPDISTRRRPYWKLETPEKFLLFYLTPTAPILVPDGFITDKGSIPLFFQNIISNYDREMMIAFLVHDVECEMQRMTRFSCDGLIYEVGSEMQASWLKKNLVYAAVRFGNRYGKKDRIVDGFNISKYNRDLIRKTEIEYNLSYSQMKHLDFVEKLRATI